MAAPIVQASGEKLRQLAELRAQKAALDAKNMAELDVFALLNYQPNCLPWHQARKRVMAEAGITDPADPLLKEPGVLPPLCGKCPQELFHAAKESDVLFGGAAGGGKSVALVAEALKWCARYAGLRAMIVRRTYDELAESIIPALRKFGFASVLGAKWNGALHTLRFPHGSILTLRYLETVDDAARRQGGELQWLGLDEASLLAPGLADFLRYERVRSGGGQPVIGVRATANPGGPSHLEVKTRYVDSTDHGRFVYTDENGQTIRFIPSLARDNPWLDAGYIKRLDAIPDPARRAAMRDGDWDQFSGMVFPDFNYDRHVVDPIPIPATWRKYCGIDWGFTAPFAVLHGAEDEDGRVWIYREIYARQVGEAEQARMVLDAEGEGGEGIIARWADSAMWSLRGDAKSVAQAWADAGVHLTPASKGPGSRIQGWQRIHSYLAEMPACPMHRSQGWETCGGIHIFASCRNLISEIRSLPYATVGNPEDSDPKASDHAADALRYLLTNLGGGATFYDSPEPAKPLGAQTPLTPMGRFAVAEDPQDVAARGDSQGRQGATQTWEQAVAAMGR